MALVAVACVAVFIVVLIKTISDMAAERVVVAELLAKLVSWTSELAKLRAALDARRDAESAALRTELATLRAERDAESAALRAELATLRECVMSATPFPRKTLRT